MISPTRTFYLQAESPQQVSEWVKAITDARTALLASSTQSSAPTAPIPIPRSASQGHRSYQPQAISPALSHSHSPYNHHLTSSESEDNSPSTPRTYSRNAQPSGSMTAGTTAGVEATSPSRQLATVDSSKTILASYLMKCGSRRHTWHNRWFVLSGDKLVYSRSHMVRSSPACV
jgi:pleckstrin homology domain-containing family A member 1/2